MKPASVQRRDVGQMDTAMQWVLRLGEATVTEEEVAEWLAWYELDERNKKAFDEMREFWHQTGDLAAGPGGADRVARLARSGGAASARPGGWQRRYAGMATAAAVAIVALIGAWFAERPGNSNDPAVIAVRETPLPDGSKVQLAARTEVTVQYSATERLLEMRGGEAYFKVAPNRDRPFIVKVGDLRVRAIGTAFNIRHAAERMAVTVTEGVVDVYSGNQRAPDITRVEAGSVLTLAGPARDLKAAPAEVARSLAWREGRLEYINEPLSAVIADVNRYSTHPLTLGDAAVSELKFTGTVQLDSIDDWVKALPSALPVELVTTREAQLLVRSATPSKPD